MSELVGLRKQKGPPVSRRALQLNFSVQPVLGEFESVVQCHRSNVSGDEIILRQGEDIGHGFLPLGDLHFRETGEFRWVVKSFSKIDIGVINGCVQVI